MAKIRYIDTRFWHDTYIRSKLNPLDRYLFLYFLTNDKTNISGIYELPIEMISYETGLEEKMIKTMFRRLKGKIYYIEGWVVIKNFLKYQNTRSPKIKIGIKRELEEIPAKIKQKAEEILGEKIGYRYGIDTTSHFNFNFNSNSNLNLNPREDLNAQAQKSSRPMSLSQFMEKCKKSKEKHIWLLGDYADEKQIKFETTEQWDGFVERNIEDAKKLSPYSREQIATAMRKLDRAKEEYLTEWNLKTLYKFLDQ